MGYGRRKGGLKSAQNDSSHPHSKNDARRPCNYPCNATVVNATGNDCSSWTDGGDYHPKACDNETGLPWLCHDGFANPVNDHLDRGLWDSLYYSVPPLALSARQRTLLPASPDSSQFYGTSSSVPQVFGALTSGVLKTSLSACSEYAVGI